MNSDIWGKRMLSVTYMEKGMTNVLKWEVLTLDPDELLIVKILSTNSENIQGIRLSVEKDALMNIGIESVRTYWIWENNGINREYVFRTNKRTNVSIYNVCRTPSSDMLPYGEVLSQMDYSGMIAENKDNNTLVYHCNDLLYSHDFDSLVFEIKRQSSI